MSLHPGTKLGPYEIISALEAPHGSDSYKALDTRLNREVHLKVYPDGFSERMAREVKAVASLHHSHICALHDIGHQDGIDFLVMEYLEGKTLAQRLEKGALDLDDAILQKRSAQCVIFGPRVW